MTAETLRHYDRKVLFQPAKRGENFENKYRYYALTQITMVKMIRVLSEIGVPLETIKDLTNARSPEKLIKLLNKQKKHCSGWTKFSGRRTFGHQYIFELLVDGISAIETELSVSEMPEKQIILGEINEFYGTTSFHREFMHFLKAPHKPELNLSYPIGGYFDSMNAFLDEPSQSSRFFSLGLKGYEKKNAGLYLTLGI